MSSFLRAVFPVFVAALLAGCFQATTALEPQGKALSAGSARIYVVRPSAWSHSANLAKLKIDGQDVGAVANNSFLHVDRPPGRHTLSIDMPFEIGTNDLEVHAVAGRSYYFVINMKPTPVYGTAAPFMGLVMTLPEPQTGQPVKQKHALFGGTYLAELDAAAGSALVAKMKAEKP
jgi:hypothetical protein